MRTIRTTVLFAPLLLLCAHEAVQAADAPPQEQVVIEATRTNLSKLAKDVVMAEQRFYQRYNDLNTVRKYAVNCYNEATTSTHFKRLYCQPVYESEAQAEEARDFLVALGASSSAAATNGGPGFAPMMAAAGGGSGPASAPTPAMAGFQSTPGAGSTAKAPFADIEEGRPGFQKNVIEVTKRSPELQKLLDQHHALVDQYNSMYRKLNDKASPYDKTPEGSADPKADAPSSSEAPAK